MATPTLGAMIAAMGSPAEWGAISTSLLYWDNATGRLGIGTASLTVKLHVAGNVILGISGGTNNSFIQILDGSIITKLQSQTAGDTTGIVGTESNNLFKVITNNVVRMTFDTAGLVGIGTAAPDERLTLIVADNSGDCKLKVGNNLTDKNGVLGYSDGSDFLYVQGGVWGGQTRQLNLQGGGGNVCVGAFSTTGAKLSVDGGLNVGAGNDPGDNNLVVQGTAYIYGTLDAGLGGSTGTAMVYSGTRIYFLSSSERFKDDITRNWKSDKLADYLKISPIKFKPKREIGDHNGDPVNPYALGFSAEEVHASGVPGLINYDKEEKPMSLREHGFLVYHHLILQEFEKRIAALEGR